MGINIPYCFASEATTNCKRMSEHKPPDRCLILLLIGYVSIAVAIAIAYSNPATSYELSIYQQTPLIFWIGTLLSLTISVIIAFITIAPRVRATALSLGSLSMIVIVLLPVIRNYYYIGEGDGLGHLGIALDINEGHVSLLESLYPASHLLSVTLHNIAGIEIRSGLMILLAVFITVFILFVSLTARLFSNDKWIVSVATFSSLLLLPVNHFTGSMHPHTSSYTMFFIPLVIYLFIIFKDENHKGYTVLFVSSMIGIILLHPQLAANLLILFSVIAILQLIVKTTPKSHRLSIGERKIYTPLAFMGVVFWLWTEGLGKVSGNIQRPLARFLAYDERETGGNARAAVPSLETAGGSIEEVLIKLFFIGVLYCIFSSVLMTASLTELLRDRSNRLYKYGKQVAFSTSSSNLTIIYLTCGFTAIVGVFLVYLLANQSTQYFRHQSFLMVIVTIIGSLSLGQILKIIDKNVNQKVITTGVCSLFVVFLLLSVPVVHVSPYIYQESQHVPESQLDGYETAFEHQDETIPFAYIRSKTYRYHDAITGERKVSSFRQAEPATPPYHFSEQGSLRSYYEEQTYLAVTIRDRTRDRDLHRGVRYTREDYEHFDKETGIDRVQDNGGFTLYRINPLSN